MSKLKLLLLGGIFTLIGIFNFSSAESYQGTTYTCSVGGQIDGYYECSDDYIDFDVDEGNYVLNINTNLTSFTFYGTINLGGDVCSLNGGNTSMSFPGNYNLICSEQAHLSLNFFGIDNVVGNTPALVTFSISSQSGGGEGGEGGEGGQIIPGGFDNFTPAINGLHETVKQLIPLVVYLGIGVLVVILGFIAIRWLVNWMSNGIKSKFSSKRS